MRGSPPGPASVPVPMLDWRDGHPHSRAYDDIYYRDDGRAEVEDVFIGQNGLAARMARLRSGEALRIGETGFGTGLGFLAIAQRFEQLAPAGAWLEFTSVDHAPPTAAQLQRTRHARGDLAPLLDRLIAAWPPRLAGWHGRWVTPRVRLQLAFDDAEAAWQGLAASDHPGIDAWCLDGFAPDRNPAMWSPGLFRAIAALCRDGATLATFTVAGQVRRGLRDAGFECERVAGTGRKRQVLRARWTAPGRRGARRGPVTIVGAGLAGAHLAAELTRRGVPVQVLDHDDPGAGSRNPHAVLHARLLAGPGIEADLRLRALALATSAWRDAPAYQRIGTLHVAGGPVSPQRLLRAARAQCVRWDGIRLVERSVASALAGTPADGPSLWHPGGGWADLCALTRQLLADVPVRRAEATAVEPGSGRLIGRGGEPIDVPAGPLVIAAGTGSASLLGAGGPALGVAHGTMSRWTVDPRVRRALPRAVVSGGGAVIPGPAWLASGATWSRDSAAATHPVALAGACAALADDPNAARVVARGISPDVLAGARVDWSGARSTTRDRWPLVGCWRDPPRVLLSTGFGAAGLALVPLATDLLLHLLLGEPAPLDAAGAARLDPHRRAAGPPMARPVAGPGAR